MINSANLIKNICNKNKKIKYIKFKKILAMIFQSFLI